MSGALVLYCVREVLGLLRDFFCLWIRGLKGGRSSYSSIRRFQRVFAVVVSQRPAGRYFGNCEPPTQKGRNISAPPPPTHPTITFHIFNSHPINTGSLTLVAGKKYRTVLIMSRRL
ncbi:hypothetical protein HOY82DRAFT_237236 [Tuber indicum]|nr:hypothetical protein HOY82DRAFT_237236 [Tuber indicum]